MKRLILIALVACCFMSCKKFLSEFSQTDVIPKTTAHFGEILLSDGYPKENLQLHSWTMFLDDDIECYSGPTLANTYDGRLPASVYLWQPNMATRAGIDGFSPNFNSWSKYYEKILGANVVLQYINDATGPQSEKDYLKGQAHALRAFYHFMLVNLYARPYNDSTTTPDKIPGIPVRTTANLSDTYLPRNSVKEVYEQIEKDLDTAVTLLEKQKITGNKGTISFVAAHLLASRVYLYSENWEKAIYHADKVIAAHPELMDLNTWGGMPDPANKPLVGPFNVESIWCYGTSSEKIQYPIGTAYDISHSLANCFEPNDLRALTGFYVNPPEFKIFTAVEFSQMKFISNSGSSKMLLANSWRSAEAYLNRAEAYIQLYRTKGDAGAAGEALISLNTLRANRIDRASFTEWTLMPADQLLESCRTERRRELYFEEVHRWFDLRRYGMPSITHIYRPDELTRKEYSLKPRDLQYVISIPEEVLQRNPALSQNPQIPGDRQPD